jgi:hypothetical protein
VADLRNRIFMEVLKAPACIRLLNATGVVGCSTKPVAAPLLYLSDAETDRIPGKWTCQ